MDDAHNCDVDDATTSEMKTIVIPESCFKKRRRRGAKNKEKLPPKEKKKRVVSTENRWKTHITDEDLAADLDDLWDHENTTTKQIVHREIKRKLDGYKRQDVEKQLYDEDAFVTLDNVVELLRTSPNCFYCQKKVKLLYEVSRDPEQWTLERISNDAGHNFGNVEISCLSCNIRRRTMYHEKYRFTKQVQIVPLK
jgi:hypothetical protein